MLDLQSAPKDLLPHRFPSPTSGLGTDIAGIFVRWDSSTSIVEGLVLGFIWTKPREISGDGVLPSWPSRLKMDEILMGSADSPEDYVSTIKEFHPEDTDELQALQNQFRLVANSPPSASNFLRVFS